jgi:hypothetical protein
MRTQRTQSTNVNSVGGWLGRIFRLDFTAFSEIRASPSATSAAIAVVFFASMLAGLGSWLWALQTDAVDNNKAFIRSFLLGGLIQTMVWFAWVYIAYLVLTWGYGARQDFRELTRSMGFAFAPVALSALVCIGALAVPIGLISFMLAILFTNAAIQQSSDADADEVIVANVLGFSVFAIVMGGFANVYEINTIGGLAPGLFFFALDL